MSVYPANNMSVGAELARHAGQLQAVCAEIAQLEQSCALRIAGDPLLVPPAAEKGNMLHLEIQQQMHNAQLASDHLHALWVANALIHEIKASLGHGDKEGLRSVLEGIKKLHEKVENISSDLAIQLPLKVAYKDLVADFTGELKTALGRHVDGTRIQYSTETNGVPMTIHELGGIIADFEEFTGSSDVSDVLNNYKKVWDEAFLRPLIAKRNHIELNDELCELRLVPPTQPFLSHSYFSSVTAFVTFVNMLDNQNFKNYYATAISNSLVQVLSDHIDVFMAGGFEAELKRVLSLVGASNWTMPIRQLLGDNLQESIEKLHVAHVTDQYIEKARRVFENFDEKVKNVKVVAVERQVEVRRPKVTVVPLPAQIHETPKVSGAQAETVPETHDDWNQAWSEDEESDKWSDNNWEQDAWQSAEQIGEKSEDQKGWTEKETEKDVDDWGTKDDGWDWDSDVQSAMSIPNAKEGSHIAQPVLEAQEHPAPEMKTDFEIETKTESYNVVTSALADEYGSLLFDFSYDTKNSDPSLLVEAIGALALISYPSLTNLFIFLNDFEQNPLLALFATREWDLVELTLNVTLHYDLDVPETVHDAVKDAETQFDALFQRELKSTNEQRFSELLLKNLNALSADAIGQVVESDVITSSQSESFGLLFDELRALQSRVAVRLGKSLESLPLYNKSIQAQFLVSNHLRDIMDYFYQGELFDFSTEELIKVIHSLFVPSDLRERCTREIEEIRRAH